MDKDERVPRSPSDSTPRKSGSKLPASGRIEGNDFVAWLKSLPEDAEVTITRANGEVRGPFRRIRPKSEDDDD
jgi:hypothetical protein